MFDSSAGEQEELDCFGAILSQLNGPATAMNSITEPDDLSRPE
jgi:hypothetical protein